MSVVQKFRNYQYSTLALSYTLKTDSRAMQCVVVCILTSPRGRSDTIKSNTETSVRDCYRNARNPS